MNSPVFSIAFLGMTFGAAVSPGAIVFTTPFEPGRTGIVLTLFVGAVVLTVFFGIHTIWGFVQTGRLIKEIKRRPPTVG